MEYLFLGIVKIIDNIVSTFKSISTYQEKKILSSVLVALSQLIFYCVVAEVISDNSLLSILIVSVSSGIGNYIAFTINYKFKKAAKWTYVITSSYMEDIKQLCEYLVKNKIKYIVNDGYTRSGNPTLNVIAFSKSKEDSRKIETYLSSSKNKYLKEII